MVLRRDGQPVFTLGMYERPRDDGEWKRWTEAGINLVCSHSREHLDENARWGVFGWVPVPMILNDDDDGSALAERIHALADHPALAVWEAPDEAIWHAPKLNPNSLGKRLWVQPPQVRAQVAERFDALVRGIGRGSALVRSIDPVRKLWLNESGSNQRTIARVCAYLDIVGFDAYPVPPRVQKPFHHIGLDLDRFRAIAPGKEIWMVEQGFAWANLPDRPESGPIYPTRGESRFMAWNAIIHGATGLLWWGSSYEKRPCPFLDDLMAVVRELNSVQPFLTGGEVISVRAFADTRSYPATATGIRHLCRCAGDATMLVLTNEDPFEQDAIVTGLDWLKPGDLKLIHEPVGPSSSALTRIDEGFITPMGPYEARVYVAQ